MTGTSSAPRAYELLPARGVIGIEGSDAREFLQNLVSNDVRRLARDHALYALLLTAQGKFLHDFFLAEAADGGAAISLDCEGDRVADLLRRLTLYRLNADVVLGDISERHVVAAAFGPGTAEAIGLAGSPGSAAAFAGGIAFVDPRLAALGVRAILPRATAESELAAAGFVPAEAGTWDRLRLAHGVPDGSRDIEIERTFPLEAGLDALHGIDYGKGCYIGQELTARTHYRGTVRKRLFPVTVEGPLPEPGTEVRLGDASAGEIRSGRDGAAIALLRIEHVEQSQAENTPFTAGGSTLRALRPDWFAPPPS